MGAWSCTCNANDGSRYPTSYTIASEATGNLIGSAKFNTIATYVNQERARRGYAAGSYPFTSPVGSAQFNAMWAGITTAGYTNAGLFNGVATGNLVNATDVNSFISFLNAAAAVCVCNCNYCTCDCNYCTCDCNYCTCDCNYCTCDCNYCTCNCNYACTCDCNYSDVRLKNDIKFVRTVDGINIYSWSYIWDKTVTYLGVLAQELVGTKYEHCLNKDNNGYYIVDYSKLPVNMVRV